MTFFSIKWLTNTNECFKRAVETSLGIAKGLVNVRNVNVFINGIQFESFFKPVLNQQRFCHVAIPSRNFRKNRTNFKSFQYQCCPQTRNDRRLHFKKT